MGTRESDVSSSLTLDYVVSLAPSKPTGSLGGSSGSATPIRLDLVDSEKSEASGRVFLLTIRDHSEPLKKLLAMETPTRWCFKKLRLMCPEWWSKTALGGSAARTLTEDSGNQSVANRVGAVRTADVTGFHQSGHMSRGFLSLPSCRGGRSELLKPQEFTAFFNGVGIVKCCIETWRHIPSAASAA
jgi:hypothetical protein